MTPQPDEHSPYFNRIPMPPVMSEQITRLLVHKIIDPLRKLIISQLEDMIKGFKAREPSLWFTIFLCIFVLVHNSERCIKHNKNYAARHKLPVRQHLVNLKLMLSRMLTRYQGHFGNPTLVEELKFGADTILWHFHAYCRGTKPLDLTWDSGKIPITGLSADEEKWISKVSKIVKSKGMMSSKHQPGLYSDAICRIQKIDLRSAKSQKGVEMICRSHHRSSIISGSVRRFLDEFSLFCIEPVCLHC